MGHGSLEGRTKNLGTMRALAIPSVIPLRLGDDACLFSQLTMAAAGITPALMTDPTGIRDLCVEQTTTD